MSPLTERPRRSVPRVPGSVPGGAVPIAVLELQSSQGLHWRERVWLLRREGRDSLWAAVTETPDRAVPVAAMDSTGSPQAAAFRLLAGYVAETRAEIASASPASALLPAEQLAAILALRRGGWSRH